jgi:citrate lyase beta subunit
MIALQVSLHQPQVERDLTELVRPLRDVARALILPSVEQPALVRRADGLLTEIEAELGLPARKRSSATLTPLRRPAAG